MSETTVTVTHLGTATLLFQFQRGTDTLTVITDPAFDPPGSGQRLFGLPGLSYRRLTATEPLVDGQALPPIDVVLLSHDHHRDNFDVAGRALAADAKVIVTTTPGARRLSRSGFSQVRGLRPANTTEITAGELTLRVTATPARHGPPLSRPVVGACVGFLLEWTGQASGPWWISGDTVWHRRLRPLADLGIAVAFPHLGRATLPLTSPIRYTMGGADLARLRRTLGPATICPVHYQGWSHFREGYAQIEAGLASTADSDLTGPTVWLPLGKAVPGSELLRSGD